MSKSNAFPFLRLPPEIRIIIYNLVLTSPGRPVVPYSGACGDPAVYRFRPTISIVNVNRQIRYETLPILYGNNRFVFFPSSAARVLGLWDNLASRSLSSVEFYFNTGGGGHPKLDQALDLLLQAECLTDLHIRIIRQDRVQTITPLRELPHLDKLRRVKVYGTLRVSLSETSARTNHVVHDRSEERKTFEENLRAVMVRPKSQMREGIQGTDGGLQASSS